MRMNIEAERARAGMTKMSVPKSWASLRKHTSSM